MNTKPHYNGGKWTEARMNSFIKSALRSASQRWPPKYESIKEACTGKKINNKTGRIAAHYLCNNCKEEFPLKEIQVDHIEPVIDPSKGFVTWDEVIVRMFCEKEGYQILCKSCHSSKTTVEKQTAKERNKK